MPATTRPTRQFRGLNNIADPLQLGLMWATRADNLVVTESGVIESREGYSMALPGAFAGAYSTLDFSRMFAVIGNELHQIHSDLTTTLLAPLLSRARMQWEEVNKSVFFTNGVDSGVITPDNWLRPWVWESPNMPAVTAASGSLTPGLYRVTCTFELPDGRETGNSPVAEIVLTAPGSLQISNIDQLPGGRTHIYVAPANETLFQHAGVTTGTSATFAGGPNSLGRELQLLNRDPLPPGVTNIAYYRGRMHAATYMPEQDQSVVWVSDPLAPHLFDMTAGYFLVPGQILMLAAHETALLIGTSTAIWALTDSMTQLADYGVVPGWPVSVDRGEEGTQSRVLFWTQRGVATFPSFRIITEQRISVAPGTQVGTALVERDGQKRFVASLHRGGQAFNSLT